MQTFKFTLTNWNGLQLFFPTLALCQLVVHLSHSIHHRIHSMPEQRKNQQSFSRTCCTVLSFYLLFFQLYGKLRATKTHKFTQKHYFSAKSVVVVAVVVVVADSFFFLFLFHLLLQSNCFHQIFHIDGLQSIKGILAYYTYIKQSARIKVFGVEQIYQS